MKRFVFALYLAAAPLLFAGGDSLVILQLRNLEQAANQAAALAEELQLPVPPGMIQGQIGAMLMSPDLAGVDATQPVIVHIGKGQGPGGPPMMARFSVTGDGADYLAALERMMPSREEISTGVHKFVMGDPDDASAPAFFVVIKQSQALAGQDLDAIKAMNGDLTPAERDAMNNMPGELSASVNVPALSAMLGEQIEQQRQMMEMYKAQMEAEGMDTSMFDKNDPTASLASVQNALAKAAAQLEVLVFNLDLAGDITLRTYVQGTPDSALDRVISDLTPAGPLVMGYQHPEAWFLANSTMSGFEHIIEPYANWVASMYKEMGPPLDAMAEPYREMMLAMRGLYTGGYNIAVLPITKEQPLNIQGIYEISDKAQAKAAMEKMMEIQAAMNTSSEDGMPYRVNVTSTTAEPHNGVEIQTFLMSYQLTDPDATEAMPEALSSLFENITYHIGYLDNALVYAIGPIESLHGLIDYVQGGGATEPHRPGFADVSAEALGYWELDVTSLLRSIAALLPPELAAAPASAAEGVNASLRGLTIREWRGVSALTRLTKQDLAGFVQIGMSLAMKGGGGAGNPGLMMPVEADEMMMEMEEGGSDVESIDSEY